MGDRAIDYGKMSTNKKIKTLHSLRDITYTVCIQLVMSYVIWFKKCPKKANSRMICVFILKKYKNK
jgi:hypothetical protein